MLHRRQREGPGRLRQALNLAAKTRYPAQSCSRSTSSSPSATVNFSILRLFWSPEKRTVYDSSLLARTTPSTAPSCCRNPQDTRPLLAARLPLPTPLSPSYDTRTPLRCSPDREARLGDAHQRVFLPFPGSPYPVSLLADRRPPKLASLLTSVYSLPMLRSPHAPPFHYL